MTRKRKPKQPKKHRAIQKNQSLSSSAPTMSSKLPHGSTGAIIERQTLISGPLPPPVILEQYDNIISDGAERIMAMTESQSLHRQQLEKQAIESMIVDEQRQRTETRLGQVLGFFIAVIAILAGVVIIVSVPGPGGVIAGSLLGCGSLAVLVNAFRYDKSKKTEPSDNQENK